MRRQPFALCLALASAPSLGLAAPAEAPWATRLADARTALQRGRFADARAQLTALLADAPGDAEAAQARALADLATFWDAGGWRLQAPSHRGVGRTTGELARLYIDSVWFGVGTGAWTALLTESDSAAGVALPALGFAGLAAGAIAYADAQDALTYGLPRAISAGLRIGLLEGIAWAGWYQAQARWEDELSGKQTASLMWGMTAAGAVIGGVAAATLPTTPGRAAFVESGALWSGLVAGLTASALVSDDSQGDDAFMLTAALALNVGAAASVWLAGEVDPSADRALYLDLGGIAGGLVAGGLYAALADDDFDAQLGAGLTALGISGGLAAAWFMTRALPPDPAPGRAAPHASLGITPLDGGASLGLFGQF